MQLYRDYAPTAYDRAGAFLRDQGDWLVVPCGRNRDSGPLDESNFAAALALLGGEGDDVEVHRFGHWGCGWFEIILARPDTAAAAAAAKIESRLEDYPVLDEDDLGEREFDLACETWARSSVRDRVAAIGRYGQGCSVFAARRDDLPEDFDIGSYLY